MAPGTALDCTTRCLSSTYLSSFQGIEGTKVLRVVDFVNVRMPQLFFEVNKVFSVSTSSLRHNTILTKL